jgi:hypothetical protein
MPSSHLKVSKQIRGYTRIPELLTVIITLAICSCAHTRAPSSPLHRPTAIQAYCIDFNWGDGGPNGFAAPGLWADADPAEHIAWYKEMGVNVVQTFAVSCNGYAWYKGGCVPEQPNLKHDFLPEMVRLGHTEDMLVMGYFCAGANTRWAMMNPDLSYGHPSEPHIPYTDDYLNYLDTLIRDAIQKSDMDGFMIDWLWQPTRSATNGKWIKAEKELYQTLMHETYPGDGLLSREKETEYGRRAIARTWQTIKRAARETNPLCIIWLTSNNPTHPHVINSDMYKEVDWLMNEAGDSRRTQAIQSMVGPNTRLITCLAKWNKQDAATVVPQALQHGWGLYGFCKPTKHSLIPLAPLLDQPISQLKADNRNIGVLYRAYHGLPLTPDTHQSGAVNTQAQQ